jgi:hypothetical protein
MITAKELKTIFESSEYQQDIEALSSYAANIKQERPMVLFLAKYLYQMGHLLALEQDKCDLVVDGTGIEFKFHFDFDVPELEKELKRYNGDVEMVWKAVREGKLHERWTVTPGIYKDIFVKRPDIFVWIVCSRDLSGLRDDYVRRVCMGDRQRKYNKNNPHSQNGRFLNIVGAFFTALKSLRPFLLETATIATAGDFPSRHYIWMCDFVMSSNNVHGS